MISPDTCKIARPRLYRVYYDGARHLEGTVSLDVCASISTVASIDSLGLRAIIFRTGKVIVRRYELDRHNMGHLSRCCKAGRKFPVDDVKQTSIG